MKKNTLQKRLYGDTFISGVIAAGTIVVGISNLTTFFAQNAKIGRTGTQEDYVRLAGYLDIGASVTLIGAALVFLFLTFLEIRRTGRPFSKKIRNYLRWMGGLSAAGAISCVFTNIISGFINPYSVGEYTVSFVNPRTMCFLLLAAVVLAFSEIVAYGCEIQEDVDSIA